MVEKHRMSKDHQTFYKCIMCNITINIMVLLHNYKKSCEVYAVHAQGLANHYDQFQN